MTDPTADGFAERIQQMHVPEPKADREALLLRVGAALIVVGLIAIVVAYIGASGTAVVAEQIPYAISGGVIGLALIIIGSALAIRFSLARLFRFWLARVTYEHQAQTDRTVEALGRIEAALGGRAPGPTSAAAAVPLDGTVPPVRRTEASSAGAVEG